MPNKTIRTIPQERTPIPEQEPEVRVTNFSEGALGYRAEDALREAQRCLMSPEHPCIPGCPVEIDIPGFIQRIAEQDFRGAYDVLSDANLLPSLRDALRANCTVGEICGVLRDLWGTYDAHV